MLRFKRLNYVDKLCTGMEAFSMLVPDGWTFEGGIRWSPDSPLMPAAAGLKVSGPNGASMQALPGQAFFWTNLRTIQIGFPVGSKYLGAVVCPPFDPVDTIKKIVIPSLRPDVSRLRIVSEERIAMDGASGFEAQFESVTSTYSRGGKVRIEYLSGGEELEEEIVCTVSSFEFLAPAGNSDTAYVFWMLDNVNSFKTHKGMLDGLSDIFQSMVCSFRFNPPWFDRHSRIVRFLKDRQMQRFCSMRQVNEGAEAAEYGNAEAIMRTYTQRHEVHRRIADHIGKLGDVTSEYYDPIQEISVRLPLSYSRAWANDRGEYLLSGGDLEPDIDFIEMWKMMERIIDLPGPETPATSAIS